MGMDTITVVMISVFGTQIGCAASAINPFSTGIASDIAGISFGDGIIPRLILFFVLSGTVAALISLYAKKVQANPEKSVQFYRRNEDLEAFGNAEENSGTSNNVKHMTGLVVVFIMTFVIMLLALFPWTSINEHFTFFTSVAEWINTTPIISTVIGSNVVAFGDWYFTELTALMLVMCLIAGFMAGYDLDRIINIIIKGAAELVSTALIVPMARGIQVIMTSGNITSTILHATEVTLGSLPVVIFVILAFVIYLIFACFLPSSTGLAGATISVMEMCIRDSTKGGPGRASTSVIYQTYTTAINGRQYGYGSAMTVTLVVALLLDVYKRQRQITTEEEGLPVPDLILPGL